jgi:hypothetical protein
MLLLVVWGDDDGGTDEKTDDVRTCFKIDQKRLTRLISIITTLIIYLFFSPIYMVCISNKSLVTFNTLRI